MTEDEGSAIALSEDLREKSFKEVTSGVVVSKLSTTALDALAIVAGAQVQTPEASHVQNAMIIPTNATSVAVNPFSIEDEPSEDTLEPSPEASQNTEPLRTPVNNPSLNMVIYSRVDEAPPQFSPWRVEHSPSMSPISPVLTATTPPTAGDAQDDDNDVDMTRVKRRTVYKKKPAAKKKKRQAKEVEIAENTEVEGISPPKRITRQGAQSMAQAEGSSWAVLQQSPSIAEGSKSKASSSLRDNLFSCKLALRKYPSFVERVGQPPKGFPKEIIKAHPSIQSIIDGLVEGASWLMRFTNNPKPSSIIEVVEEMKNTILGEVQKATTKLKKTFKARTDKLQGKIHGLQAEVSALKEERVKWLEYRIEKDRVKKREWQKMDPDKQMHYHPSLQYACRSLHPLLLTLNL
ncbi:hypothetical protein L6452_05908 [Arctium lappa]|uniref:Uncharacterized protein n=1 Tax=Arctium lappa TaxID=4217 RepID=A0ACB9EH41_ARCLA|nr:hypothetical protein L6452_05908 [Arctium lappa]